MTRNEEIEKASKNRADQYSHPIEWNECYHHFKEGAEWADKTMTQKNKDALIAEIERLQDAIKATAIDDRISKEQAEAYKVCVKIRSFVEDNF